MNCKDAFNRTPALIAAQEGQVEMLKILIDAKADLSCQARGGETAAIVTAQNHQNKTLRILMDTKADIPFNYSHENMKSYIILYLMNKYIETHDWGKKYPPVIANQFNRINKILTDDVPSDSHPYHYKLVEVQGMTQNKQSSLHKLFSLSKKSQPLINYLQLCKSNDLSAMYEGLSKLLSEEKPPLEYKKQKR